MVLALNMMDESARKRRLHPTSTRLEEMLGIPVVPISAAKNEGVDELIDHAVHMRTVSGTSPGRHGFLRSESRPRRRGAPLSARHHAPD